jgi:hypothetical protein
VGWNIDRGSKLHKVIEFLAGEKADIILLPEADLNARRTHHSNVARQVAQKLAMNCVFGREFQELTQGSKTSPAYHRQATRSRWPRSKFPIPEAITFLAPALTGRLPRSRPRRYRQISGMKSAL